METETQNKDSKGLSGIISCIMNVIGYALLHKGLENYSFRTYNNSNSDSLIQLGIFFVFVALAAAILGFKYDAKLKALSVIGFFFALIPLLIFIYLLLA